MKRIVAVSIVAVLALGLLPGSAAGHHRPTVRCSPSGDVCQSTRKVDGIRKLRITLAAKYFSRYRLCVTAPDDVRTCKVFRIRDQGAVYGSSVRWARAFPRSGPGAYDVRWQIMPGRTRVGRLLGFHVPAP